jgi:DNA-binding MarR family transcriptional regulator
MPRSKKTRRPPVDAAPRIPGLDLNGHIATKVAIFANCLSRSASRFYRERYGIGVVEWRLMMFIGHASETRANRICGATDLDKGAVSRSLRVLQGMGIVSVREDGADSRRNNVALTAKGRALHDRIVPIALQRQRELVSDLAPHEVEAFIRLIDRLQAKVANGEPAPNGLLRKRRQPSARPLSRRPASGQIAQAPCVGTERVSASPSRTMSSAGIQRSAAAPASRRQGKPWRRGTPAA